MHTEMIWIRDFEETEEILKSKSFYPTISMGPSAPIMAAPDKPNTRIHSGCDRCSGANQMVANITPAPTTSPRTTDAPT